LALVALARGGIVKLGMCISTVSKSARGYRRCRETTTPVATKAREPDFDATTTAPEVVRAIVAACVAGGRSEERLF
jgi:hypothetical protein